MSEKKEKHCGRPWLTYVLSFAVPVMVMLLVLKARGFYPFGEKTLFIMDMRDEYIGFFSSLRSIFSGEGSLFFSWSRSMGGNYMGLFAFYIASPLSFITALFPVNDMPSAIVLLTLLKIGLSGLSFAVFGVYISRGSRLPVLPFAVSYALFSYNIVYYLCPMWLDGVILLPAILLGVEKILDGRRGLHYMLSLACLFVANYYTGYMAGIFTALYLLFRILCIVKKDNIKEYAIKALRFTACTLLAIGLSAPLLLPMVKDLMQGKLSVISYVPDANVNFEFMDIFGKLKNGVYDSITNSGLPAIYCGYAMLALIIVFFVLPRISLREKAGAASILIILTISFYFIKIDMAWHGFQYPNWFPYRYAFVMGFFMMYMAMRAAHEIFSINKVKTFYNKNKNIVPIAAGVLCLIAAVDMGINAKALSAGLENEFGYTSVEDYEKFMDKTQPLVSRVKEEDTGFYRINQGYEFSKNDAMLLGYNGMTHYSSTFNAAVNSLTSRLGIAQSYIWNSGYGSNQLLDSLFSVKYILRDKITPPGYKFIDSTGEASLYGNEDVLPIVYTAPCVNDSPQVNSEDPFANQNSLLNSIAGTDEEFFTEFEYETEQQGSGWSYSFTADSDNPVYLYMKPDNASWADVYVNDAWVGNYFSTETTCSLYLGSFEAGQRVVVNVVPSGDSYLRFSVIAQLNMDVLRQTLGGLREGGMEVTEHGGGKLYGRINVGSGQKIVSSIPYDSGWTVRIDGKKAETGKLADTFLTVEAESGEHEISFEYVSPGFGMGMILFAAAAVLALIYFVPLRKLLSALRKNNASEAG